MLNLCWSCPRPHWDDTGSIIQLPTLSEVQQWLVCTQPCGAFQLPDCVVQMQASLEAETFRFPNVVFPVSGCSILSVWVDGCVLHREDAKLTRAGAGVFF